MLLITMNEWIGPGRKMTPDERDKAISRERLVSFATQLSLGHAIDRIAIYQRSYNENYRLAVNFRLIQVAEISEISREQAQQVGINFVEELPQGINDFKN